MYQGKWVTLLQIMPYSGMQFAFYEGLRALIVSRLLKYIVLIMTNSKEIKCDSTNSKQIE